ncbi:MAG: ATP-binding protein [Planctomycetes bacterium]|nr:ATP-binding protein [Planctomycetota bacterium]
MIERPTYVAMWEELARDKAMVFLAGPRQAGKTTLAKAIAERHSNRVYVNWDILTDRARLAKDPTFFESVERRDGSPPLVVFDEIHKSRDWKNYLKGVYDRFHAEYRFLVAGSGRLDQYRKGGDSLAGRYLLFHLWPLTLAELAGRNEPFGKFSADPLAVAPDRDGTAAGNWGRLGAFSGFPEPYTKGQPASYRRWSDAYGSRLVREDIRDLTGIRASGELELLHAMLPDRVGSPLSIQALAEEIKVSYNTVKSWLEALERFYAVFTIGQWTRNVARATAKARKLYLFDAARVPDPGARFENRVALELFRAACAWTDMGLGAFALHFVRDKEKHEVDFLLSRDRKPFLLVEAKASDPVPTAALRRFQDQLGVPAVQLADSGEGFRRTSNGKHAILSAPAPWWIPRLP